MTRSLMNPESSPPTRGPLEGRRILLVEDNLLNQELVVELLESAGCEVIVAGDAETGLAMASNHQPDLVLMDTQLPGMDGLTATARLGESPETREIPVVALSAHAMAGDRNRALEAGSAGYMKKPVDTRSFVDEVSGYLRDPPPASPPPAFPGRDEPVGIPGEEAASSPLSIGERGARILVVDDEPHNRELLHELLAGREYRVTSAVDGPSALEEIRRSLPDVILLDVMMPGMTGFEVCREVKANPRTAHLPVLMITALHERQDRIEGIDSGADDFLKKPVDRDEVLLRVRNAVQRTRLFEELSRKHRELQEMEALREQLTGMLVHDMRTPLTAISANLQLLEWSLGEDVDPEALVDLRDARAGTRVLADMVSQILVVSRARDTQMEIELKSAELREMVEEALAPLRLLGRNHDLRFEMPDAPVALQCDPPLVRRVVSNLFGNAVKFVPAAEGRIEVRAMGLEDRVRIEVEDNGPGIPAESHVAIFERFMTAGPVAGRSNGDPVESSGIGLSFCKLAVEAHGGRIGVESETGVGSLFWFELPLPGGPGSFLAERRSGSDRRGTKG
jgi:two-component system, sensor histidine kinase and response regulator